MPGEGLFRGIVRNRCEGDAELRELLKKAPQNAFMTSPKMQNALIEAAASYVRHKISKEVRLSSVAFLIFIVIS